jgi:lysophospholipase L1-like esterase
MLGKTIAFVGDSITELYLDTASIAAKLGATGLRFGFRGTQMSAYAAAGNGVNVDKFCMHKLADAIATGSFTAQTTAANNWFTFDGTDIRPQAAAMAAQNWANVDVLVVCFGTNDYGNNRALGVPGDATGATFIGAVNYTIATIQAAYPAMQIMFVAPLYRDNTDATPNSNGIYLSEFADVEVRTAKEQGIPALNLYRLGGINEYNTATYLVDGVHPTAAGINRMTEVLVPFLGGGATSPGEQFPTWSLTQRYRMTPALIAATTVDGADIMGIEIAGGGTANNSRGAYMGVYGNEHATLPGVCLLVGASVLIIAPVVSAAFTNTSDIGSTAVRFKDGWFDGKLYDGIGEVRLIPQNSKSAAYTLVLADAGKHIFHPAADTTARIWTIPANSSVPYPIGTAATFINQNGAGVITIAITTDTMRLAGAGTTGSRTLAANGMATAIKVTSTEWIISGTGLT